VILLEVNKESVAVKGDGDAVTDLDLDAAVVGLEVVHELGDAIEVYDLGGAAGGEDDAAEKFRSDGGGQFAEGIAGNGDLVTGGDDGNGILCGVGTLGDHIPRIGGEEGEAAEGFDAAGPEDLQERHEVAADAVAEVLVGGVGGVFAPGLAEMVEVVAEVHAADTQEGAVNWEIGNFGKGGHA
jgi:hypothetical protein